MLSLRGSEIDPKSGTRYRSAVVTREIFRSDRLDLFWRFVCERQKIWRLRIIKRRSPPWTRDPILRNARFTNVYRELDPGTQYLRQNILELPIHDKDKIFNVMLYRLIGRMKTYSAIGLQHVDTFDPSEFVRKMKRIRDIDRQPIFSGAYVVSGYVGMGSHDKVDNVARLLGRLQEKFDDLYKRVVGSRSAKEAYEAMRGVYGFGVFLAYQVVIDLMYQITAREGSPILPFSNEEWAIAGPGTRKGISMLLKKETCSDELSVMRWLKLNQKEEFARLGLDFPYLTDDKGRPIEISLSNIENCLCEFHKYLKIRDGTGRARRRFTPRYSEQLKEWLSDS